MNLNYNHFVSLSPDKKNLCITAVSCELSESFWQVDVHVAGLSTWQALECCTFSKQHSSTEHNVSNFKLPSFPKLESVSWYIPFCFYIIYLNPETHRGSCKHVRLYSCHAPTLPEHFLKLQNRCTSCQKLWNVVQIIWNQKRQYANNHFIHSLLS